MKKRLLHILLAVLCLLSGTSLRALDKVDGVYQLGTAQDFADFVALVNGGEEFAQAVLTADIDYTTQTAVINTFKGVLDGAGHTLTIAFNNQPLNESCLVNTLYGRIVNLRMAGSIISNQKYACSFVQNNGGYLGGCVSTVTITSSITGDATAGGLCSGVNYGGVIEHCAYYGNIVGVNATCVAGLVGWAGNVCTVKNCLVVADFDVNLSSNSAIMVRNSANNCKGLSNCYYKSGTPGFTVDAGAEAITDEELRDGSMLAKLNVGLQTNVWSQEGDAMPMPMVSVQPVTFDIATPAELVAFANTVNDYNGMINGRLTADIDMEGIEDFPMIGISVSPFKGDFDGQRHTIKNFVLVKEGATDVGLFGTIAAAARVHDFVLDENSVIKAMKHIGLIGLADKAGTCWIYNIGNKGNVEAIGGISSAGVGGILGNGTGGVWAEIDRCYMMGNVSGTEAALISGWQGTNQGTVSNCWAVGEVSAQNDKAKALFRHGGSARISNCWSVYGTQGGHIEAEEVANGGLCYKINKEVEQPVWFQTLGVDAIPTLYGTDVVYAVGSKHCDGTQADDFYYSNENLGFVQDPHEIDPETGLCNKCGQVGTDDEGYCLIPAPAALMKFAEMVNEGQTSLKARLTADIDLAGMTWTPIGNDIMKFNGIIDGQNHKISNLVYESEDEVSTMGFVGTAVDGARFYNFYLDETCSFTANSMYLGAIVGHSTATGTVSFDGVGSAATLINSCTKANCGTAGIMGNANASNKATFDNCWVAASIEGQVDNAAICAWLGNVGAYLNNCWAICDINKYQAEDKFLARFGGCTFTNCYANKGTKGTLFPDDLLISDIASGKVCYLLNGDQSQIRWYQNLGEDHFPLPWSEGHKQVYANGDLNCDGTPVGTVTYGNTQSSQKPDHEVENGFCMNCGMFIRDYITPVDGFYPLATGEDIVWFATLVNEYDNKANAKLTDDIDMTTANQRFPQIGAPGTSGYGGTFDGQNHTISYLRVTTSGTEGGLIGQAIPGMHLRNLIFDKSCSIYSVGMGAGMVGGSVGEGTIRFTNLINHGTVETLGANGGGIFGWNHSSASTLEFTNCGVTGSVKSVKEGAAIAGWAGHNTKLMSCWSIAEIEGGQDGRWLARLGNTPTVTNCYAPNTSFTESLTAEEVENGALTWKLNGRSFINPTWFQNVGEDECPTWIESHGVVYPYEDSYATVDRNDEDSYLQFRDYIISSEQGRMDDVVACTALIEAYLQNLTEMETITNFEAFCQAYLQLDVAKTKVDKSAKKYVEYATLCKEMLQYLADNEFYCDERVILENYLNEVEEPSDTYPNGTYLYIVDRHELNDDQLAAEIDFVNYMLTEALKTGYLAGSEITNMLVNPKFADGFNGWDYTYSANTFTTGGEKTIMPTAEAWNCTFDLNQTLKGLHNGVYEVRVNAAFRAGGDITSTFYAGMLYANGNVNYIMTEGEDFVSKSDAEDGVNCHLSGEATDYSYVYGTDEGWVPYGPLGCSYAFNAGRYVNSTIAVVTDGELTIGLKNDGSGIAKDWMGFSNFRLFFLGDADQSGEALDRVLEGYVARANTILDFQPSEGSDYNRYPNFSADLKESLEDAIAAVASAATGEQKVSLVGTFTQLFQEVYTCRQAYIKMLDAAMLASNQMDALYENGFISDEQYDAFLDLYEEAWTDFIEGNVSAEEALAYIARFQTNEFLPAVVDGYYQLGNANDLGMFALLVNSGMSKANAVLTADIDLADVAFMPIGFQQGNLGANESILYAGEFDGQGHTISNLVLNMPDQVGVGLFGSITTGANIRNLILDATCSITGKDRAGIVGRSTKDGEVFLSNLGNEGTVVAATAPAGILGNANNGSIAHIANCYSTGAISGSKNAAQICGWFGAVGGSLTNCWSISEIEGQDNESNFFYRTAGAAICTNCYTAREGGPQATYKNLDSFASGEVTYLLNTGETENPVWYQTLGEDALPVFDATHKIVKLGEDGKYYNDGGSAIDNIASEVGDVVDVYDVQGRKLRAGINVGNLRSLPAGLYIMKGESRSVKAAVK